MGRGRRRAGCGTRRARATAARPPGAGGRRCRARAGARPSAPGSPGRRARGPPGRRARGPPGGLLGAAGAGATGGLLRAAGSRASGAAGAGAAAPERASRAPVSSDGTGSGAPASGPGAASRSGWSARRAAGRLHHFACGPVGFPSSMLSPQLAAVRPPGASLGGIQPGLRISAQGPVRDGATAGSPDRWRARPEGAPRGAAFGLAPLPSATGNGVPGAAGRTSGGTVTFSTGSTKGCPPGTWLKRTGGAWSAVPSGSPEG